MNLKDFKPLNFAKFHPGGSLGKKLLTQVSQAMHTDLPTTSLGSSFLNCVNSINSFTLGLTLVIEQNTLYGIITDGDIRRAINKFGENCIHLNAADIMTPSPKTIHEQASLYEAEKLMHKYSIHAVVVLNTHKIPIGILSI